MKQRTLLFLFFIILCLPLYATKALKSFDKKTSLPINITGFVKHEPFWDSRQVDGSADDESLRFPEPKKLDPNGEDIIGQASNVFVVKDRESITLTYIDSTQGWLPTSGYQEGTEGLTVLYSVDFLVVAGGGGGG